MSAVPDGELRGWAEKLMVTVQALGADNQRLREEMRAREEAAAVLVAAERARADALARRVESLERRLGRDSSNSSKPPSSDSPYVKKPRDRSLRGRSGRRAGKQPGARSSTLRQSPDPDVIVELPPPSCGGCGRDLAGTAPFATQKRQVAEAAPPPPPVVTEYRVQSKICPGCGHVTSGRAPEGVTGRMQYGPGVHAAAALAVCGHFLPVRRAARLVGDLTGVRISAGFAASVRGKAASLLAPFTDWVRQLLAAVPVLHADETPARAAGQVRYLHVACTQFLTAMHAGDRTRDAVDAGQVLPGYTGTLVRDGYHQGYGHLADALHAWCGAHLLRDLKGLHGGDPHGQDWAQAMARVLLDANAAATAARAAGDTRLSAAAQAAIRTSYRDALAAGIEANWACATQLRRDGLRLAKRFGSHEDMILRFITDLAVPFTNNQAERDIRPAKIAQRSAGGTWRTLLGLADFAVVWSYLSTAAKWGITPRDALIRLFTTGPWLPPAPAPG